MHGIWKLILDRVSDRWQLLMYGWRTLCCTIYCSWDYTIDTAMEPAFWFVDNFAKVIGPIFVCLVVSLTALFVFVAYLIGIPYWWHRSPSTLVCLYLVGHWILANIVFNYYMALTTAPGLPPRGVLLPETASVCRKCISPKPPRTHHCSVCDTCILKMDHHCPWLNQCVGHFNHRFFLLYMMYMTLGTLMVMLYGYDILWQEMFGQQLRQDGAVVEDDGDAGPLMVPVIDADAVSYLYNQTQTSEWRWSEGVYRPGGTWRRCLILFESLISAGVFLALGGLSLWHGKLITRGETSIEAHINRKETARLAQLGQVYSNPYNMGAWRNWKLFLGLQRGRGWRHVVLPSRHLPETDGLTWRHLTLEDAHIKLL